MGKILLTGATGYLGSSLLKGLLDKTDYEIVLLKRSFSNIKRIEAFLNSSKVKSYDIDKTDIEQIFIENKIETIIHCATNYGREDKNKANIEEANLNFPLKLLNYAIQYNVENFINTDTVMDKNVNDYSITKKQFLEKLIENQNQIKCVNMALEHFYGAGDNITKFPTFLVDKFLNNAEKIDLTKGEQKRYFIYIDDVVDAYLTVLNNIKNLPNQFTEFEVSSKETITIKDFVLLLKELTGNTVTKLNFGVVPYRENELMESKSDISKLQELGWNPRISLKEGLKKLINGEKVNEKQ